MKKFTKRQVEALGRTYLKMPNKSDYQVHAHVNPFSTLTMPTPLNPRYVDWQSHFDAKKIVANT